MSDNINRSEERIKQTAEVFTPKPLVNEILDQLPKEIFIDPKKTFCDPACGDGQFLVEVLKRKLASGSSAWHASKSIYGVDFMEDNILLCRRRLSKILSEHVIAHEGAKELSGGIKKAVRGNIICSDALDWDFINWRRSDGAILRDKIEAKRLKDGKSDQSLYDM